MTTRFDHLTIEDVTEDDEYSTHPEETPIDISDYKYRIDVYEDHGPRGTSKSLVLAKAITLNGGSFDIDSKAGITKEGATLEQLDETRDGLVNIQI